MVMELLRKMLEVTMTRGAQSAGLVTYRQDGGDAQGCRARTVSGKRTDLARLVLSKFSRVIERRRPLLGAGLIAAPQLFQGHTRFATTSLTTLGGCHPHQWCPLSKQKHWSWADGGGGATAVMAMSTTQAMPWVASLLRACSEKLDEFGGLKPAHA